MTKGREENDDEIPQNTINITYTMGSMSHQKKKKEAAANNYN